MKNDKILIIIISFIILSSCSKGYVFNNLIIINSEKSKKWNLPELNINVLIPKKYELSYNESEDFYLKARKFDKNGKLLAEISIGQIDGELKDNQIMETLKKAEKKLITELKNIKQIKYETSFIGEDIILGKKTKNLRGIMEFDKYRTNIDGKFYFFKAPIILDDKNKFMLSSIIIETEKIYENKIGIELLDFMISTRISE